MASRLGRVSLIAGCVAALISFGGFATAHGGIVIGSGRVMPIGDPTYEYVFDVQLTGGTTLNTGGYITVYDLPGVYAGSTTSQPSLLWGASIQYLGITPTGTPTITDSASIYNVTWQWNGPTVTNEGTGNVDLGNFVITTNLTSPPAPTLVYVGSLGGNQYSNMGLVIVPEPSSALLLGSAGVLVPAAVTLRRRRRRV